MTNRLSRPAVAAGLFAALAAAGVASAVLSLTQDAHAAGRGGDPTPTCEPTTPPVPSTPPPSTEPPQTTPPPQTTEPAVTTEPPATTEPAETQPAEETPPPHDTTGPPVPQLPITGLPKTAMVAAGAGAGLVAVGVLLLWLSRRRADRTA